MLVKPLRDDTVVVIPDDASLTATIKPGKPAATVTWFKEDKELRKDPRYTTSYKADEATLTIAKLDLKDAAHYRVEAANKMGKVQSAGYLTVHSK